MGSRLVWAPLWSSEYEQDDVGPLMVEDVEAVPSMGDVALTVADLDGAAADLEALAAAPALANEAARLLEAARELRALAERWRPRS